MYNDISFMANHDDNIAEQVIEQHAESKGVLENARTLKKAPSTISRIVSQNSDRGVPETANEQQPENTETAEGTTKQRKSNTTIAHG